MKFCAPHWQKMRDAVRERDMERFIARSPEAAMRRLHDEMTGTAAPDDFDPLMWMNNILWSKLLELGGINLMMPNEDGSDRCPLCFMNEAHKAACEVPDCTYTHDIAIDWAANAAKAYVDEHLRGTAES